MPSVSSLAEAAGFFAAAHADGRNVRIGEDVTTERLDRVLEHEAGDLTCTVESGVRLSALRTVLARAGQRLSLDPPGDPSIGAVVAGNLSGPLRHRFGAPRDLVLGVTLVLGDGTIANAGGKVVKNVAGYDLGRLVCGSRGRLAFVARVSLRLHPIPRAARTLVAEPGDPAAAVATLLASRLQPSAVDILHPGRLAVLFEGAERAVEAQLDAAQQLIGGVEVDGSVWDESRRRQAEADDRIHFDPGDLPSILDTLPPAIVRASAGVAYASELPRNDQLQASGASDVLVERIKSQLDPKGILA